MAARKRPFCRPPISPSSCGCPVKAAASSSTDGFRLLTASPRPLCSCFIGEKRMTPRRPLVAGNWKMNGLSGSHQDFCKVVAGARGLREKVDIIVCPPATLVRQFVDSSAGIVEIGGQDCHAEPSGAFTGDISAE